MPEPGATPPREPVAATSRPLIGALALASAIWAFVVLAYVARVGYNTSGVVAVVTALIPTAVERLHQTRLSRGVLAAILAVEILATGIWGGVRYYLDHKPINVTGQVQLTGNTGMAVDKTADAMIHTSKLRPKLKIVFQVSDTNEFASNCASETSLHVNLDIGAGPFTQAPVSPGQELDIPLPGGLRDIHLRITTVNNQYDRNCTVNLRVPNAQLHY